MEDHEIATKRLSDWKPETDIKLQKAFGKFVEEAGELLEAMYNLVLFGELSDIVISLENELADCDAIIAMIVKVVGQEFTVNQYKSADIKRSMTKVSPEAIVAELNYHISRNLAIIGRCQIQGLKGSNPETEDKNSDVLIQQLSLLKYALSEAVIALDLNKERIQKRTQAKIDSKLPWVMGTATDLLPDKVTLNKKQHPAESKIKIVSKLFPDNFPVEVVIREWTTELVYQKDVSFSCEDDVNAPFWYLSTDYLVVQ